MGKKLKTIYRMGLFAATVVLTVADIARHARQLKDRQQIKEQLQTWEDEGGAPPPPRA